MIVSMNVSHFVKNFQVLKLLHQLIRRGVVVSVCMSVCLSHAGMCENC